MQVDEAVGAVIFTITRSISMAPETVFVSTVQNKGSVNHADYIGKLNEPVSFAAGETSKIVTLQILDDTITEGEESFGLIVQQSPGDPVSVFLASATFTITEVANPTPTTDTVREGTDTTARLSVGGTVTGTIDQNGIDGPNPSVDKDWYRVDLVAGRTYTFNGTAELNGGDTLDALAVRLYNSSGVAMSSLYDGAMPSFTFTATTTGAYYLAVSAGGVGAWQDKTGDFRVESGSAPRAILSPSDALLEYFSRVVAYEDDLSHAASFEEASGWDIEEIFKADYNAGARDYLFSAVAIRKDGYLPVLVFRGTTPPSDPNTNLAVADWLENTSDAGVGVDESINAWAKTGIRAWLAANPGAVLTGHSQGGAQAQWFTHQAAQQNIEIGELVTFNSPGVNLPAAELSGLLDVSQVTHYISAGDIVSQVGERFVPGKIIYYDFDIGWFKPSLLAGAHSGHWYHTSLNVLNKYILDDNGDAKFVDRDIRTSYPGPDYSFLSSPDFTHLVQYPGIDNDFFAAAFLIQFVTLVPILEIFGISQADTEAILASIRGAEEARTDLLPKTLRVLDGVKSLVDIAEDLTPLRDENALEFVGEFISRVGQLYSAGHSIWKNPTDFFLKAADTMVVGLNGVGDAVWAGLEDTVWLFNGFVDVAEFSLDNSAKIFTGSKEFIAEVWDMFTPGDDIVLVEGAHAGSTPAIVVDSKDLDAVVSSNGRALYLLGEGKEYVEFGDPNSVIFGFPVDSHKTEVDGFTSDSAFFIFDAKIREGVDERRSKGSALLELDTDRDGTFETWIKLHGNYKLDGFVFEITPSGTYIRYTGNVGPEGADDTFSVYEGQMLTGNVLVDNGYGADSDPDGDLLSVRTGTFATANGGSVVLSTDGSFTYSPDLGFSGADSFDYTLLDGKGGQDTGTVSVEVKPDGVMLNGGNADDTLIGGAGDDQLSGGNGNDTSTGNSGNDQLSGGNGDDMLGGGSGDDRLEGGNGNDNLFGDDGIDHLTGGNGDDILNGGARNDHLEGGNGNDKLTGGNGDDTLIGGNGADIANGGAGDDSLSGGNGDDTFVFKPGFGNDTVEDFRTIGSQQDKLQFDISLFADENHVFGSSADTVDGVLITADAGDTLLIRNTTVAALHAHPEDLYFV